LTIFNSGANLSNAHLNLQHHSGGRRQGHDGRAELHLQDGAKQNEEQHGAPKPNHAIAIAIASHHAQHKLLMLICLVADVPAWSLICCCYCSGVDGCYIYRQRRSWTAGAPALLLLRNDHQVCVDVLFSSWF
jgi:hypothetical protein